MSDIPFEEVYITKSILEERLDELFAANDAATVPLGEMKTLVAYCRDALASRGEEPALALLRDLETEIQENLERCEHIKHELSTTNTQLAASREKRMKLRLKQRMRNLKQLQLRHDTAVKNAQVKRLSVSLLFDIWKSQNQKMSMEMKISESFKKQLQQKEKKTMDQMKRQLEQTETEKDLLQRQLEQTETEKDLLQRQLEQTETEKDLLQRQLEQTERDLNLMKRLVKGDE